MLRRAMRSSSWEVEDLKQLGYPGQGGASAPQSVSPSSSRTPCT
jgi:hypothetical protein